MALNIRGKDRYKNPNFQTFCVLYLCTRHKRLFSSRLRSPQREIVFVFSLSFPAQFSGNQPDKSLISVIDNVCYVYPHARALCENKGANYEKFNVKSEKFNVILTLNYGEI